MGFNGTGTDITNHGGVLLSNAQTLITSTGTSTWSKPSGCRYVKVTVTAGGGGGQAHNADDAGGGGGAGGTAIEWIDVAVVQVTTTITLVMGELLPLVVTVLLVVVKGQMIGAQVRLVVLDLVEK